MGWWSKSVIWIYLAWQISISAKGLKMQVTNLKSSPRIPTAVTTTSSIVPSTNNINPATIDFNMLNDPLYAYKEVINAPNSLPNINYDNIHKIQNNINQAKAEEMANIDSGINNFKISPYHLNQKIATIPGVNYNIIPIDQNHLVTSPNNEATFNRYNVDNSYISNINTRDLETPINQNMISLNQFQENNLDITTTQQVRTNIPLHDEKLTAVNRDQNIFNHKIHSLEMPTIPIINQFQTQKYPTNKNKDIQAVVNVNLDRNIVTQNIDMLNRPNIPIWNLLQSQQLPTKQNKDLAAIEYVYLDRNIVTENINTLGTPNIPIRNLLQNEQIPTKQLKNVAAIKEVSVDRDIVTQNIDKLDRSTIPIWNLLQSQQSPTKQNKDLAAIEDVYLDRSIVTEDINKLGTPNIPIWNLLQNEQIPTKQLKNVAAIKGVSVDRDIVTQNINLLEKLNMPLGNQVHTQQYPMKESNDRLAIKDIYLDRNAVTPNKKILETPNIPLNNLFQTQQYPTKENKNLQTFNDVSLDKNIISQNINALQSPTLAIRNLQQTQIFFTKQNEDLAAVKNIELDRDVLKQNIHTLENFNIPFNNLVKFQQYLKNQNQIESTNADVIYNNNNADINIPNSSPTPTNFNLQGGEAIVDTNTIFTPNLFNPFISGLNNQVPVNRLATPVIAQQKSHYKDINQINEPKPLVAMEGIKPLDVFPDVINYNRVNMLPKVLTYSELYKIFSSPNDEGSKLSNFSPKLTNSVENSPFNVLPQVPFAEASLPTYASKINKAEFVTSDQKIPVPVSNTKLGVSPRLPNKKELKPIPVISALKASANKFDNNWIDTLLSFNPFNTNRTPPLALEQSEYAENVDDLKITNILKSDVTMKQNPENLTLNFDSILNQHDYLNNWAQNSGTTLQGSSISTEPHHNNNAISASWPNLQNMNIANIPTPTLPIQQSRKFSSALNYNIPKNPMEVNYIEHSLLSASSSVLDKANEVLNTSPPNTGSDVPSRFPFARTAMNIPNFIQSDQTEISTFSPLLSDSGIFSNNVIDKVNTFPNSNMFLNNIGNIPSKSYHLTKHDNIDLSSSNVNNIPISNILPNVFTNGNSLIPNRINDNTIISDHKIFKLQDFNLLRPADSSLSELYSGSVNDITSSKIQTSTSSIKKDPETHTSNLLNRPFSAANFVNRPEILPELSDSNLLPLNRPTQQYISDLLSKPNTSIDISPKIQPAAIDTDILENQGGSNIQNKVFSSFYFPPQSIMASFPNAPITSNSLTNYQNMWPYNILNTPQMQPTVEYTKNPDILTPFSNSQNQATHFTESCPLSDEIVLNNIYETFNLESEKANALALQQILGCSDAIQSFNVVSDLSNEVAIQSTPLGYTSLPITATPDINLHTLSPTNILSPQIKSLPYVNPSNVLTSQEILNYAKSNGVLNILSDLYKTPLTNYQQVPSFRNYNQVPMNPLSSQIDKLLSESANSNIDPEYRAAQRALSLITKMLQPKPPQFSPITNLPPVNPYLPSYPSYSRPINDYTVSWPWLYKTTDQSYAQPSSYSNLFNGFEVPDTLADISFDDFPDLLFFPEFSEYDDNFNTDMEPFVPYMSSLTVNVLPVIEDKRLRRTNSPSSLYNLFDVLNFSPSHLPSVNMPGYQTTQIIDVQALQNINKGRDGNDLSRLLQLLALSELLNGN